MARPRNCRRVASLPRSTYFKPRGVQVSSLEEVVLTVDELEALRLGDLEGMYQEKAANAMNISRQTFGRIIESAHRKVAKALVHGKALKIEGGDIEMKTMRTFRCSGCHHQWQIPHGTGRPQECPACKSSDFHRTGEERGHAGACADRGRRRHGGPVRT